MAEPDKWSRWLAETRFGGDQKAAEIQLRGLTMLRKRLLKKAGLAEGKVVLDVGAGEGLIGFGALDLVGATGRVIFSDISERLVEFTRTASEQMGVLDRCTFVTAGAEDLSAIESESVDLVTTRSVLIYIDDKPRAFREFFRVLKPGGRTALFEPIDDQRITEYSEYWRRRFWADPDSAEGAAVKDLIERLNDHWEKRYQHVNDAMLNFNERDLLMMAIAAGFAGVHVELDLGAGPMPPMNWNTLMKSSGNPLIPTNGEVIREIFTPEEQARFEHHLRPIVERGGRLWRTHGSFTWAFKAPIPEKPWPEES
ncbi:MAG: class I SAM-dependent methyltransferase [Candidatus Binatus sp.]|uniref:class I SAM-dependent methyltransferase n=1 Tax=Candidatus Binatus sp. TaxID=2811406 RepID=UPI003BB05DB2